LSQDTCFEILELERGYSLGKYLMMINMSKRNDSRNDKRKLKRGFVKRHLMIFLKDMSSLNKCQKKEKLE